MARYKCPICRKYYNTTTAIKFHIETVHTIKYMDMVTRNKRKEICISAFPYAPFKETGDEL